jgi:hypothetical protein
MSPAIYAVMQNPTFSGEVIFDPHLLNVDQCALALTVLNVLERRERQ